MNSKIYYDIYNQKEKVREELVLAMRRLAGFFKMYITDDYHFEHPDYNYYKKGEDYGLKNDTIYYYYLSKEVHFIYQNNHYCAKKIEFHDKFRCWAVYDKDKKEHVAFDALDTDSQIELLEMLDDFLDVRYWNYR